MLSRESFEQVAEPTPEPVKPVTPLMPTSGYDWLSWSELSALATARGIDVSELLRADVRAALESIQSV